METQRGSNDPYLVFNMAIPSKNNISLTPPVNVNIMNVGGVRVNPALALTEALYSLPSNWFSMETVRINYSKTEGEQTHKFNGVGGTISIMKNDTTDNSSGTLFVKNSHPRHFTVNGDKEVGTEYEFSSWLENVLNTSKEESNQAAIAEMAAFMEEHRGNIDEDMAAGIITKADQYFIDMNLVNEIPAKPVHYIVMVKTMKVDANGKAILVEGKPVYDYDMDAFNAKEQVWLAKGYEVIGVNGALALPNLGVENFRLNGCIPCVPVNPAEIAEKISQWTMENYHRAVKPVTDLSDWFQTLMATNSVKSMSISFNNIAFPDEIESAYRGVDTIVQQYQFTTGEDKYESAGVDSAVPAFTINLWTTGVLVEAAVSQAGADEAARNATVHIPKGKKRITTTIEQILKFNQTHTPGGLFAARQAAREGAKATVGVRRPAVPEYMATLVEEAATVKQSITSALPVVAPVVITEVELAAVEVRSVTQSQEVATADNGNFM